MAGRRRRRICTQCGSTTDTVYSDEEWKNMGQMCEECYILEFPEGEYEEDDLSGNAED